MIARRAPRCAENPIAAGSYRRLRRGNSHGLRFTRGATRQPAFGAEVEQDKTEDARGTLAAKDAGAVRTFDSAALFRHRLTSAERPTRERCAEQSSTSPGPRVPPSALALPVSPFGEVGLPTVQVCGETKGQQRCA